MNPHYSFLESLLASSAAKSLCVQTGCDGVLVAKNHVVLSPLVVIKFGDFSPFILAKDGLLQIRTRSYRHPFTKQMIRLDYHTTVNLNFIVGPEVVWKQIVEHYKDLATAHTRKPITITVDDVTVVTLERCFFQAVGWSAANGSTIVAANCELIGIWREMTAPPPVADDVESDTPFIVNAEK